MYKDRLVSFGGKVEVVIRFCSFVSQVMVFSLKSNSLSQDEVRSQKSACDERIWGEYKNVILLWRAVDSVFYCQLFGIFPDYLARTLNTCLI